MFNCKTKSGSAPAVITLDSADNNPLSRTASTLDEIAELFNAHFASVLSCSAYVEPIPITPPMPTGPFLTEITLTPNKVLGTLQALEFSKATGPDGISARLLKETAREITHSAV